MLTRRRQVSEEVKRKKSTKGKNRTRKIMETFGDMQEQGIA